MAPELLLPEDGVELEHLCHTKATDVWAFGMVVYVYVRDDSDLSEVFTESITRSSFRESAMSHNAKGSSSDDVDCQQKTAGET